MIDVHKEREIKFQTFTHANNVHAHHELLTFDAHVHETQSTLDFC